MKYLELIKGQFTADHEARAKQLEPYVAYSEEAGGVMYTFIPEPVTGPADNEIWYTTTDGKAIPNWTYYDPETTGYPADQIGEIISNSYENGIGKITCKNIITVVVGDSFTMQSNFPENLSSIILPNSVTSIGGWAFPGCSLTSIAIPNSVTSIGMSAFENCSRLTSVTIGNSVTSIEGSAFYRCSSLTSITIPNSVTSIEGDAFAYCSSLTSIAIPNSVTSIGVWAFNGCEALTSITFEGTMEEWNSINKGNDWNDGTPATYVQCSDGQVTL